MTARRRLAALARVALAACAIGVAARESGALAPLEREALKARFDVRGTEPVEGLVVVGIDAKTFTDLHHTGRSRARSTPRSCAACTRRAPARSSTTSSSPSPPAARGPRALRRARRRRRRHARHQRERRPRPHPRAGRRREPARDRLARRRVRPSQRHERRDRQLPARGRRAREHRRGDHRAARPPHARPDGFRDGAPGSTTAARPARIPTVSFSDVLHGEARRLAACPRQDRRGRRAPRRRSATCTRPPSAASS